jgi:hypothetical protein
MSHVRAATAWLRVETDLEICSAGADLYAVVVVDDVAAVAVDVVEVASDIHPFQEQPSYLAGVRSKVEAVTHMVEYTVVAHYLHRSAVVAIEADQAEIVVGDADDVAVAAREQSDAPEAFLDVLDVVAVG